MIKRLINFENNFSLAKAAATVGFFALLSRVAGFIRDSLMITRLGAGNTLDIYNAAFIVPDTVFNLLILGTLSVAFIPVFTELMVKDKARANSLANTTLHASVLGMGIIAGALFLLANPLTRAVVPGFASDPEKFLATVKLMRLFLLSPIIFTVSNVFTSILNSQKKFFIVSLAPIFYNAGIIIGLIFLYPRFGLVGLGWGVILGALLHMVIQIPEAIRHGWRWEPVLDFHEPQLYKMMKLFIPRILGMDNSQISIIVGTIIGSLLATGSITIFKLANNLQAVPLGVFAYAIATASFPVLSEYFAKKDEPNFIRVLNESMANIFFFMIPITILLLIFRAQVVRLGFGYGEVDWPATRKILQTLGILSFALTAQGMSALLSRAFYARQNTIIPVMVNLVSIVINATLGFTLAQRFGSEWGILGVAVGFAVSSILNAVVLFIILRMQIATNESSKELIRTELDNPLLTIILKILIASIFMGLASFGSLHAIDKIVNTKTIIGLFIQTAISGVLGLATFFIIGKAVKLAQASELLKKVPYFGKMM